MMCPDRELISAFFDGETDERWSSEIREHINACLDCSAVNDEFGRLSLFLNNVEVPHEAEIKDRVFSALERRRKVASVDSFWKKHVEVSFPALIGAAAAILCAVIFIGIRPFAPEPQYFVEEIRNEPVPVSVQFLSIEDAAAYLLPDDSGFDVLITIPSGEGLAVSGEPQLIREADYLRGQ